MNPRSTSRLLSPLARYLDSLALQLMRPQDVTFVDFAQPAGEPALVGPDSLSWRIFKNPVAVFVGGVAAVNER